MGRKRKPKHLKRQPLTTSLPIDIHLHLDKIASKGLTISRYVERLIRRDMEGDQAALVYHEWMCECGHHWRTNRPSTTISKCPGCKSFVYEEGYRGIYNGGEEE